MPHLDIEGLKEIFLEEGKAYWWLYSGTTTKGAKRGGNDEVGDIQEACDLLVRRLELYGAGVFTVATAATPNLQNARRDQHVVKLGSSSAAVGNTSTSFSGPTGLIQMMDLVERLQERGGGDIAGAVESAMENFALQQQIKDLKKEVRELKRGGTKERMAEMAMQRMPMILDRLLGTQTTAIAGDLSTVGFEEEEEQSLDETDQAAANSSPDEFSLDQAIAACNMIAEALPHRNVNQVLWTIAKFIQKDPALAESYLIK